VGSGGYIIRRAIQIPMVLLIISVMIFGLIHLTPGDPVELALPAGASADLAQKIRGQLGLDQPLYLQYVRWLWDIVHFDFGKSIQTGEPVLKMILERIHVTFMLATTATIISIMISLFGVLAAVKFHQKTDYLLMLFTTFGISIPNFFAGILLIVIFGVFLDILPISGFVNPLKDPWGGLRHIILPAISLGLIYAALHARMVRNSMLDILNQDYIRTARAKGLSEKFVILQHGLRNALLPVITVIAMNYAYMLGGSIIIEQVFALPGIGRLLIIAVNTRDFPVIQGVLIVVAFLFILINLLADVLYGVIDPRIKF
jgi:peptide/nickel transport system permease protein